MSAPCGTFADVPRTAAAMKVRDGAKARIVAGEQSIACGRVASMAEREAQLTPCGPWAGTAREWRVRGQFWALVCDEIERIERGGK